MIAPREEPHTKEEGKKKKKKKNNCTKGGVLLLFVMSLPEQKKNKQEYVKNRPRVLQILASSEFSDQMLVEKDESLYCSVCFKWVKYDYTRYGF